MGAVIGDLLPLAVGIVMAVLLVVIGTALLGKGSAGSDTSPLAGEDRRRPAADAGRGPGEEAG